jgi:hypothetical protein
LVYLLYMKLYNMLNEALLQEVYHFSNLKKIISILKADKINLSTILSHPSDATNMKNFFFLSVSRTPSLVKGYSEMSDNKCIIVFDGQKLNSRYKTMPYHYFKNNTSDYKRRFEYEERILSDVPYINQISKYIIRIDCIIETNNENKPVNGQKSLLNELLSLGKSKNIPMGFYGSEKDMRLGRNQLNDFVDGDSTTNDLPQPYISYRTYSRMLAMILYDRKYLDDYQSFSTDLEEYVKANNLRSTKIDAMSIFGEIKSMSSDTIAYNLTSDIATYFNNGYDDEFREDVKLLVKEMRRYGVNTLIGLYNVKVKGTKETPTNYDYTGKYTLYHLVISEEGNHWEVVSPQVLISQIESFNLESDFNNGYLDNDTFYWCERAKLNGRTMGDFMNYLLNKFQKEKVIELISDCGYNHFDNQHRYKLVLR